MCNLTDKFYFFTPMPNTSLSSSCRNVGITPLFPLPALYVFSSCRKVSLCIAYLGEGDENRSILHTNSMEALIL